MTHKQALKIYKKRWPIGNILGIMQNIGANNAGDAFYRYKMPKLIIKIEGKGNGIKTSVVNIFDIAKSLDRPPSYIVKYFGSELGALTRCDEDGSRCVSYVNGEHGISTLDALLLKFIQTYVQCYGCGNPETVVKIKKKADIRLHCRACGNVSKVDFMNKFNTFIIKHPPTNIESKEIRKVRVQQETIVQNAIAMNNTLKEKDDGEAKTHEAKTHEEEPDESDDSLVWATDTSAEAVSRRALEQVSATTAAALL
jgi:translation initiation factor 5